MSVAIGMKALREPAVHPAEASPLQIHPLARLVPSLADVAFLMPMLFLFIRLQGAKTLLGDGDTGWHIRTGEWILSHRAVPRTDLFSFSRPAQPWLAWEWLWDVAFASIHSAWGLTGVVFVNVILLCVIFALLFRIVQRSTENYVIAIAVTILSMAASSIHWLARPHLAGWLLLLLFFNILQQARRGSSGWFWCLPLLMAVWANVHGSFFIGIALLLAYALGDLLDVLLWGARAAHAARFAAMAVLCAAAALVNPYGAGLHRHVLEYLLDTRQLQQIGEYQSPSFQAPGAVYLEVLLFLAFLAVCRCIRNRNAADAIVIAAWAHLSLLSCRNIAIFAFFAAPAIAPALQSLARAAAAAPGTAALARFARTVRDLGREHRAFERVWRFHLLPVLASVALALLFAAPSRPDSLRAEYDPRHYPVSALKILESVPDSRIFTDDEWGDFLIYRLYPRYQVFIDGRSDFYGADMDERMLNVLNARYDWAATLSGYSINTVLLRADAPLAGALKESPRWSLTYDDGVATVFRLRNRGEKSASVPTPVQTGRPHIGAQL